MPRFFFDLGAPGSPVVDEEGIEFADWQSAMRYGLRCARDVIAQSVLAGEPVHLSSYVAVCDHDRAEIRRLHFRDCVTLPGPERPDR